MCPMYYVFELKVQDFLTSINFTLNYNYMNKFCFVDDKFLFQ